MRREGFITIALAVILALALASVALVSAQPPAASQRLPRLYEGAPPLIPHGVEERKGLCQDCHTTGEQGAPITPHPTRDHFCLQCHVGQNLGVAPFEKADGRK